MRSALAAVSQKIKPTAIDNPVPPDCDEIKIPIKPPPRQNNHGGFTHATAAICLRCAAGAARHAARIASWLAFGLRLVHHFTLLLRRPLRGCEGCLLERWLGKVLDRRERWKE